MEKMSVTALASIRHSCLSSKRSHSTHSYNIYLNISINFSIKLYGYTTQLVQRLATDWTVRGKNPGGSGIFRTLLTDPGIHPASCTMGSGSVSGVCRSGRDVGQPPLSSADVMEDLSYTSTPPLGLFDLFQNEIYFYLHLYTPIDIQVYKTVSLFQVFQPQFSIYYFFPILYMSHASPNGTSLI